MVTREFILEEISKLRVEWQNYPLNRKVIEMRAECLKMSLSMLESKKTDSATNPAIIAQPIAQDTKLTPQEAEDLWNSLNPPL